MQHEAKIRNTRDQNGFTATQARIMGVLADGSWHRQQELMLAIDDMATRENLNCHLHWIRQILKKRNEKINIQHDQTIGCLYMHVVSRSLLVE